jgi:hypothetical protein
VEHNNPLKKPKKQNNQLLLSTDEIILLIQLISQHLNSLGPAEFKKHCLLLITLTNLLS